MSSFIRKVGHSNLTKCTIEKISNHIQLNPECTVTGSVPVFTYASRPSVTRQPAGVLAAVGYMKCYGFHAAANHIDTYRNMLVFTSLAFPIRFTMVSSLLRGFYIVIRVAH